MLLGQLRNFLHKFTWIVCQFISWTNWVNSWTIAKYHVKLLNDGAKGNHLPTKVKFTTHTLSKVFYLELTCSNLKVFSSRRMCTNLKQKSEWNSLFYYSVLTFSNAFPKNTDSKIHISNPYINLLNLRM